MNATSKPHSSPNQKQNWITTTLPSGGRINKCTKPISTKTDDEIKQDGVHLTEEVSENTDETDSKPASDIKNHSNTKSDESRLNGEESSIGSTTSLNNAINLEPNPSANNQDDNKSSSTTSSVQYSLNDNNSESSESPKRTIINKYVKKVKNLIKK